MIENFAVFLEKVLSIDGDYSAGFDRLATKKTEEFLDDIKTYFNFRFIFTFPEEMIKSLPPSVDWNAKGMVTKPIDQNKFKCDSCYAAASASALETSKMIAE
jgi:hypothetical protein